MKNSRIRLTESQLHNVIKESVKRVLREGFYSNVPGEQDIDGRGHSYFTTEFQRAKKSATEALQWWIKWGMSAMEQMSWERRIENAQSTEKLQNIADTLISQRKQQEGHYRSLSNGYRGPIQPKAR